jgi:glycosyltransferase involved in cell wall biosynthesis
MVAICAVIAAFNEEAHVAAVVADAHRHVGEVVVVDDGSTDATARRSLRTNATEARAARCGPGSTTRSNGRSRTCC